MPGAANLRFGVSGSPALAAGFAALHLATLAVAWSLPWPRWAVAALMGLVLGHGAWAVWSLALRRQRGALVALELDAGGGLQLFLREGSRRAAQLVPGSVVLPKLVVLAYRVSGERCSRRVLLTPDALGAEAFRELRISLRHPRPSHSGPGGASATPGRR